jgi:hypothetical protein
MDEKKREAVKLQERAHYQFVRDERQEYYKRREMAVLNPDAYMSVILDGADQQVFASIWTTYLFRPMGAHTTH